jgi:hypothetical protein
MNMISLPAHFDGQSIQLDQPFDLKPNTRLVVMVLPESDEEADWSNLALAQLDGAYTDEDDYPLDAIQVSNPDYAGS